MDNLQELIKLYLEDPDVRWHSVGMLLKEFVNLQTQTIRLALIIGELSEEIYLHKLKPIELPAISHLPQL